MSKPNQFKSVLATVGMFVVITIVAYAFLSLCNWNLFLKEWNGLSRFVLALIGLGFLIKISADLDL